MVDAEGELPGVGGAAGTSTMTVQIKPVRPPMKLWVKITLAIVAFLAAAFLLWQLFLLATVGRMVIGGGF
jgi:hypothetical protein